MSTRLTRLANLEAVGKRIRGLRERRGLSLRECAKTAGVSAASLSRMELGGEVALGIAMQVAAVLELDFFHLPDCEHDYVCRFCGESAP